MLSSVESNLNLEATEYKKLKQVVQTVRLINGLK